MNDAALAVLGFGLGGFAAGALLALVGAIRHGSYWLSHGAEVLSHGLPAPPRVPMIPRTRGTPNSTAQPARGEVLGGNCFLCGARPGFCAHRR